MELNIYTGLLLLFVYAVMMYIVAKIYMGKRRLNKSGFLVADREVTLWKGAFSIASSWIWAPALFISAQVAYQQGIVGLFWFTTPNVLCLIIFAFFAVIIRDRVPLGYTLTDYIRELYGKRVHNLYLFQSIGLLICSIAVQLLAGSKIISILTGLPYFWTTILLAAIALSYSVMYGLRASIITDFLKINIIFAIGLTLIPWSIHNGGGLQTIVDGLGGFSGKFTDLFDSNGVLVFLSFGLPTTIGLLSGPFGDQAFWQRAFAIRKNHVKGAFIIGALIFAVVPLMMSCLGFLGAGLKMVPKEAQFINLEVILKLLPAWTSIVFVYMIMSGLISALDSHMTAISSVGGHDLLNRVIGIKENSASEKQAQSIKWARMSVVAVTIFAIAIANIPNMQLLYLFLFYGTLRASTFLPTVITLLRKTPAHEASIFWGIVVSIFIGLPIFAYGNFTKTVSFIIVGSLSTVLASAIITYVGTKVFQDKK